MRKYILYNRKIEIIKLLDAIMFVFRLYRVYHPKQSEKKLCDNFIPTSNKAR